MKRPTTGTSGRPPQLELGQRGGRRVYRRQL